MNIFMEIDKSLCILEKPSEYFSKLKDSAEFKESKFRRLGELVNIPQELKYHPEGNVWNHVCMVIDFASVAKEFSDNKREFMWGALLHDIGKYSTTVKRNGRWTSYNHDIEGYNVVRELLVTESMDDNFTKKVSEFVKFHMHHIYILKRLPFGNIKELIKTNNINDILLLFACDKLGRGNQSIDDKERVFDEVLIILSILEKESGCKYDYARVNIEKFKNKILE